MKRLFVAVILLSLVTLSGAVEREFKSDNSYMYAFNRNLALSAGLGLGIPLGDFSNSRLGNAQVGGVGSFEAEYYFANEFSLGFRFSGGIFEDRDDPDFTNWVNNYQLFGRFLVPVEGRVRPYGRFGLGLSTITLESRHFLNLGTLTSTSDVGFSMGWDAGVVWRASNSLSINGGVGYDVAFLKENEVDRSGVPVGYDPNYFSINFGISFFMKP